jgi:hypothetical protein
VAACLLFGTDLNNIAMIGIVMLVGVVVNNAILMIDHYNQLKREGLAGTEALLKVCPAKLKAILMSNIAIVLGMIPMALGIGASLAEMRQPMGIIVVGGIVSSTVLTLWFIPAITPGYPSNAATHKRKQAMKKYHVKGGPVSRRPSTNSYNFYPAPLRPGHGPGLPPRRRHVLTKRVAISLVMVYLAALNATAEEYDLSAYLQKVQQNNSGITLAYQELRLSREQVNQARAPLLPGIGAEGSYARNLRDMPRSTPVASVSGGGPLVYQDVDSNYDNELSIGIGVTQKLFDPSAWIQYRQAKKGFPFRNRPLRLPGRTFFAPRKNSTPKPGLPFRS